MKIIYTLPRWALILISVLCLNSCLSKKSDPSSLVVLKVNSSSLSVKEFADRLSRSLKDTTAIAAKDNSFIQKAKVRIVNDFILQVMVRDWAKNNDIRVHKDGEKGWLVEIKKLRRGYPDDLSFRKALSEEGLSYNEWQAKVRFNLLHKLVIKELSKKIVPPEPDEIKAYYSNHVSDFTIPRQIHLVQIVLRTEAEANAILKELRGRKSLSELARKFSITPEGQQGGDLGWIDEGTSDIFDNVFNLRQGSLSHIIKSPYGYHIIKVIDKKSSRRLPLNDVKNRIHNILIELREQAVYTSWLEDQIRVTRVFKNDELINSITVKTKGL